MSDVKNGNTKTMERREILRLLGIGTVAATTATIFSGVAHATPDDAAKLLAKLGGSSSYKAGKIKIKLPTIAENGATVPMTVSVDSPMTASNYVKAIHVASEKNPRPEVASFYFSPLSGKAEVSTRIRLGKTQNVVAVAVMSDGSVHRASQPIKVTIGGCGG